MSHSIHSSNQLQQHQSLIRIMVCLCIVTPACSTLPTPHYKTYRFPAEVAFIQDVKRPFHTLGQVKTKVDFQSLDPIHDEKDLCQNYFNKAALDMVKMARAKGADAVINIRSVVFYESGQHELFMTPECSDDGMEGQILTQGMAIQWLDKIPKPKPKL